MQDNIGNFLREKRNGKGLSRRELSERTGVSASTIYRIETGQVANPHTFTLFTLCRALGINISEAQGKG